MRSQVRSVLFDANGMIQVMIVTISPTKKTIYLICANLVILGKNSFYIYVGVGYVYVEDEYSKGSIIQIHSTLAQAKSTCDADDRCGSITDWECDGRYWATYTGRDLGQATQGDPCSWVKPGTGKLIFIL